MVFGTGISAPTLHEEPLRTSFKTRSPGSFLLNLIRVAAIIIIPIVVAFQTSNMWFKTNIFVIENAKTEYTGRYMLRATDSAGNEYFHTSSESVLNQLQSDVRNADPIISTLANDVDGDGLLEEFVFSIGIVPRFPNTPIVRLDFLPSFYYEFSAWYPYQIDLTHKMNTAPLVSISVPSTGSSNSANSVHSVEGNLQFTQVKPLDAYYVTSYDSAYLPSLLTDENVGSVSDLRKIDQIARRYAMRNESLRFDVLSSSVVSATDGGVDPSIATLLSSAAAMDPASSVGNGLFVAQIKMRVIPATVVYSPSPAEVAKWAWIQWFCIGYPIYWVISQIVGILVRGAVVNTMAVFQGRVQPY